MEEQTLHTAVNFNFRDQRSKSKMFIFIWLVEPSKIFYGV